MSDIKIIYYMGHSFFGDSFSFCVACNYISKIQKEKIYVSFFEPLKDIVQFFDGLEFISKDDMIKLNDKEGVKYVPVGGKVIQKLESGYNNVEVFLSDIDMKIYEQYRKDGRTIEIDYERKEPEYITVNLGGNANGQLSLKNLNKMAEYAKKKYPDLPIVAVGHKHQNINAYKFANYDIIDERTDDITGKVVIEQMSKSAIHIGPHSGISYVSLSFGVETLMERSKVPCHDSCLSFNNSPKWYDRKEDFQVRNNIKEELWGRYGEIDHPAEWDGSVFGGGKISQRFWEYFKTIELSNFDKKSVVLDIGGGGGFLSGVLQPHVEKTIIIDPIVNVSSNYKTLKDVLSTNDITHIISVSAFEHMSQETIVENMRAINEFFKGETCVFSFEFHPNVCFFENQLTTAKIDEIFRYLTNFYLTDIEKTPIPCVNSFADHTPLWHPIVVKFKKTT